LINNRYTIARAVTNSDPVETTMSAPASDTLANNCRMDLPRPTISVGTRTDYSVGPSTWVTRHLMAWGARTTVEEYSDRKLCMSCTM
jgi:hypothetical protein